MVRSFIAVILLTVFTVVNISAQNQEALSYINENEISLTSVQFQALAKAKEEKALASYKLVRFNNLASLKEQSSFNITLPGKASLSAERKRFETKKGNEWTMSGKLGSNGSIFLSATDGDVYGVIQVEREIYWLKPVGDGLHILIKVDPKKIPRDEPEGWNPLPNVNKMNQSKTENQIGNENQIKLEKNGLAKTTATPVIDILIVYTPVVTAHSGNITSLVNACIQSVNESFANSNMTTNVQVALVQAVQVTYTESGDVGTDKDRLITPNDGYMDNIFALRDQYHADLVVLLVDFDSYGYAGIAADIEVSSANAYCVVVANYAVGNYTFAHEVGHLIGARHDNDPSGSPRPYAHGYRYNPAYWRTIMAVYDPNVYRINYWSSPLNNYGGAAMGTADWNDDRRVWNERASIVEGFRQRPIPLSLEGLVGPSYLAFKQRGTWTAYPTGGSGNYSYQWYKSEDNGSTWVTLGTAQSQSWAMGFSDFVVRCDVHDNSTAENASARMTVYYGSVPPIANNNGMENLQKIPTEYFLGSYPNPFNPSAVIDYQLPSAGSVNISVFDVLGREVKTIVNETKQAGYYKAAFNGSELPSGIYLARISVIPNQGKSFVQTIKMVLTK